MNIDERVDTNMDLSSMDLMNLANRDRMLGNTTSEEQIGLILEQIKQPFDSGSTNYFKRLKKMVNNQDQLDRICEDLFEQIENVYPSMVFDLSEYDQHYGQAFNAIYKVFVKNVDKMMFIFLREYIFNNKNRKALVLDYMSTKIPSYPKEQYGKKEFYLLITKLPSIIRSISDENIRLEKFLDYIDRSEDAPLYIDEVRTLLDQGVICDHGIISDMFKLLNDSDSRPGILNKLEMAITKNLILPYLEENGMTKFQLSGIVDPEEESEDDDDETNDE